ncbi:hypothetical protein [Melissospora conviva]|uniref:hypothetical protein n=1 Tax=Melissospora conviva TaxID=3388432 RepID=UPI003C1674EE
MADSSVVQVEVFADGDVLRGERLARSLFRTLSNVEGIEAKLPPAAGPAEPGAKGVEALADASMWVFLTAGVQAGSRILLAAVQGWFEHEKHRTVRLRMGDRSIEVPAAATPGQERVIEAFLRGDER